VNNLERECIPVIPNQTNSDTLISVPQHLPAKILNQPISSTQDDIEQLLQAINKNIRRLNNDVPNISVDSAHIAEECKLMKKDFILMIDAVEEAYTKDLEFRKEIARLEAERLEKEKQEAEERERKRLEDERIEKERQEALEREQARLAEEARIAAEKAKLVEFVQTAPEIAVKLKEDQDDLRRSMNEYQQKNVDMFSQIFVMVQNIEGGLPHPPPPPQP
jgi:chromosome segregation ATPase